MAVSILVVGSQLMMCDRILSLAGWFRAIAFQGIISCPVASE
ncbi:hypothetical protein [Microseira wollei]|nr:hypothetical protein [Microseira wollei]